MNLEFHALSGLWLMFVLGLRHGIDPDHIAIIDSMAYRSLETRPRSAPWIGTLFALGHGLTVTLIAVGLASLAGEVSMPANVLGVLEWLPIVLLIIVGTLNLRDLLSRRVYQVTGWKTRLIPHRLRASSHPFAIFFVGVLFALVFDTATQDAAWGYAATAQSGPAMAWMVGLAFTAGMVITDTLDGRLMVRLLQRAGTRDGALAYRRKVGWAVVVMSYGIAVHGIVHHFYPSFELDDMTAGIVGGAMVVGLLATYAWFIIRSTGACSPTSE